MKRIFIIYENSSNKKSFVTKRRKTHSHEIERFLCFFLKLLCVVKTTSNKILVYRRLKNRL